MPADIPAAASAEAYLLHSARQADPRYPWAPLAALEITGPGGESVSFLLGFAQLRRLDEALYRLVRLGEARLPD